jgi:hypothetical protein
LSPVQFCAALAALRAPVRDKAFGLQPQVREGPAKFDHFFAGASDPCFGNGLPLRPACRTLIRKTKSGPAASRKNYAAELVAEVLTGTVADGFKSAAMQWGTDHEPEACSHYALAMGEEPVKVGFVIHEVMDKAGASPDRLVGDDGLAEIKCPNTATHIETLLTEKIDPDYLTQMHWQMACTGRQWCDFVSYDPRLPGPMRFFCKRVERDDKVIAELEAEVVRFLAEVDETVAALSAKFIIEEKAAA